LLLIAMLFSRVRSRETSDTCRISLISDHNFRVSHLRKLERDLRVVLCNRLRKLSRIGYGNAFGRSVAFRLVTPCSSPDSFTETAWWVIGSVITPTETIPSPGVPIFLAAYESSDE